MARRTAAIRAVLIPTLIYAVVAALLTWPLVIAAFDHAPGGSHTDLWNALWVLSWQADALGTGTLPHAVTTLNHPDGGTLVPADPLSFGWSMLGVPLLGPVLTLRVLVLARLTATGLAAHGLARDWLATRGLPDGGAWVAGAGLMASPVWLASVHNGVPEGLHGAWMVLAVWATWRCVRQPGRIGMALVAASWTMLALASWYLVIPGVAVAGALALTERPTPRALGAATVPGLLPVFALAASARAAFEGAAAPLGKALQRSQTVILSLEQLSPPSVSLVELFLPLARGARDGDHLTVAAYLGLVALLAGTLGLTRTLGRRSIPLALAALGLVVLGLGNSLALHPGGDPIAVLPLARLRWLPGVWAMEHTWRVLPGVGLVLALGAAALAARWRPLWLGALAMLVVADLRLLGPMRGPLGLSDATVPPAVAALADAPAGAVLSVPRDGQGEPYGYHQTVHGHPVPWAFDATTNPSHGRFLDALADALQDGAPIAEAAARIGPEHGIRYIVVVPGPDLRRSRHHETIRALEAALEPLAGTPPREIRSYRLW